MKKTISRILFGLAVLAMLGLVVRSLAAGQHGVGPVTLCERMPCRHFLARVEGTKSLLLFPSLLPLGFDQMKWILSAAARHRAVILKELERRGNRGVPAGMGIFVH